MHNCVNTYNIKCVIGRKIIQKAVIETYMDGGVDYNKTSTISGKGLTQQCISLCDVDRYSSLFSSDILKLAPCPPAWNKGLLWKIAKRKGLADSDTAAIASRCVVPRPGVEAEVCGVGCILLVCVGCMFLCLIGLQFYRRRQPQKLQSSRFGDTSRQAQMDVNHMNGSTGHGYDNQAYTADVNRSNSNVSNSSSTAKLRIHEELPSGHYESLDNYDTVDSAIYNTPNNDSAINTMECNTPNNGIISVCDEVTKF